MTEQRRVTLEIDAKLRKSDAFAKLQADAKKASETARRDLDQLGRKLDEVNLKAKNTGNAMANASAPRGLGALPGLLGNATNRLQQMEGSLSRLDSGFGRLASGVGVLAASGGGLDQMLQKFLQIGAIVTSISGGRQLLSGVGGLLRGGAGTAAVAGGAATVGAAGTAGAGGALSSAGSAVGSFFGGAAFPITALAIGLGSAAVGVSPGAQDWLARNTGNIWGVNWALGSAGVAESEARMRATEAQRGTFRYTGDPTLAARIAAERPIRDQILSRQDQLAALRSQVAHTPGLVRGQLAERTYGQATGRLGELQSLVRLDRPETVAAHMQQFQRVYGDFQRQLPGTAESRFSLAQGQDLLARRNAQLGSLDARLGAEASGRAARAGLAQRQAAIDREARRWHDTFDGLGVAGRTARDAEELLSFIRRDLASGGIRDIAAQDREIARRAGVGSGSFYRVANQQVQQRAALGALGERGALDPATLAELERQRARAAEQQLDAQQRLGQLSEQQRRAELDRLDTMKKLAEEQRKFYEAQARGIREQMNAQRSSFGFLDLEEQQRSLRIARQIGAGGDLGREDLEFARGVGALAPFLQALGEDRSDRTGILSLIQQNQIRPGRQSQAGLAASADARAAQAREIEEAVAEQMRQARAVALQEIQVEISTQLVPAFQGLIRSLVSQLTGAAQQQQQQVQQGQLGQLGGL